MSFGGWLLTITLVVLIFIIAIGVGWWVRNRLLPPAPNQYSAVFNWGPPIDSDNPAKTFCQLYQFPTAIVTIDGVPTAVPGTPTFSSTILDKLTGGTTFPACLDTDQIIAQQIKRICKAPNGVVDQSINRCIDIEGQTVGLGGSEQYYTDVGCPAPSACLGQLALVSVNYQVPSNFDINCIVNNGTGNVATMATCDPTRNDELFRVTRINPGQNPAALKPGQGQNGLLAQFLDRNTGLCLQPGPNMGTSQYDPAYLASLGCGGSAPATVPGQQVIVSTCTGGSFPGYVWALVPSLTYCPVAIGPTNPNGCSAGNTTQTPPQIVNVQNVDFTTFPGASGYSGLSGSSAVVQWLIDNKTTSMYYGAGDANIVLVPYAIDVSNCQQKPTIAQYLNLSTYNTIEKQKVCQSSSNTADCISL